MDYFENKERCFECKKLMTEHETFLFYNSPYSIEIRDAPEWQPNPEPGGLSLESGPARVAFVWSDPNNHIGSHHLGDSVVQVHEGPLAGVLWVPCHAASLPDDVWLWVCQPVSPKNPIDDEWMRSISS